jgi:2-hydroxychromene-2-carboxylate isomerase
MRGAVWRGDRHMNKWSNMKTDIDFYFDFSSPYGYFAATGIDELAARYERAVKWHPVLLGVVFKTTGSVPLPMVPMKGAYALHDFERTARFHGIAYRKPDVLPLSTQLAARAMLWVREKYGDARSIAFGKAVYRAYFTENVHIGEAENIGKIATAMELDAAELLEGCVSAPIKEQLRSDVEAAMARGVFGSPFIIVDDESFWGFDRFDQLEAYLKNGSI